MTESEFNKLSDAVLAHIEQTIDDSGSDIECSLNGPVMELEFEDGSKVVVNRHTPNQEMWLAAKSGGFHYGYQDGKWLSKRDEGEFYSKLSEMIKAGCGEVITF